MSISFQEMISLTNSADCFSSSPRPLIRWRSRESCQKLTAVDEVGAVHLDALDELGLGGLVNPGEDQVEEV